jgi:hypothetical protein
MALRRLTALVGIAALSIMAACSGSDSGPAACVAAGGQCLLGGHPCPNRGSQDCNPDLNPGGAFCCLPCPDGTKANDAGTACE